MRHAADAINHTVATVKAVGKVSYIAVAAARTTNVCWCHFLPAA